METSILLPNEVELLNYLAAGYSVRDMGRARKADCSVHQISHQVILTEMRVLKNKIGRKEYAAIIAEVLKKWPDIFVVPYEDVYPIVFRKSLTANEKDILKKLSKGLILLRISEERQKSKSPHPKSFTVIQRTVNELRVIYKAKNNAQLIYKVVKLGHLELKS